jgi:hypothetical protein
MSVQEVERLEDAIEKQLSLSALVEDTGGISFYPSLVPETYGLHFTLTTGVHEWVHQYLWFYPLGKNYHATSDMETLNETVANMVGNELGDRVYRAITGKEPPKPGAPTDSRTFDFNMEMRKTRLRVEELLKEGRIDAAEAYMEERRQFLAENGYYIRKLNQAYFAFHGTYADSPASISPIHDELQLLRSRAHSVGDFLRTVSRFGSYQQFNKYLSDLR